MENNANYALVGALSLALVAALFGFIYWFAGPSSSVPLKSYDIVFTGAVSGVSTGTNVVFNGVRVGQVRTVNLDPQDTSRVIVRVEVADTTPVKADTKITMGFQGLTGIGSIQFTGGTQAAGEPVPAPDQEVPTLYAESSDFQSILDGLASTVNGAGSAVDRLNTFLDANTTKLDATITDVQSFSAALASNSDGVESFLASVSDAGAEIGPMAEEIKALSAEVRGLLDAIPPDQVSKVVTDVGTFTDSLSRNAGQIDALFASTSSLATDLNEVAASLKTSAATVQQVTAQIDPEVIGNVVRNVDSFATQLGSNAENFNTIVANVTDLSTSLKTSAGQVDEILAGAGTFTDSLSRNAEGVDKLFASTATLSTDLSEITTSLKTSAAAVQGITTIIDPAVIADAVNNIGSFASKLGSNAENVDTIVANVTGLSETLKGTVGQLDSVLAGAGTFADSLSRNAEGVDKLFASTATLGPDLSEITTSLKASATVIQEITAQIDPAVIGGAVNNIGSFASKLGSNADNVDTIIANVTELSKSLNASSVQVDSILARVNTMVGEADGQGMFEDIAEAAQSVKVLADQLTAATGGIASGLNEFTSRGLSQYTALAVDARSTLQRLDTVVRNLEQNPQSLIFGGDTVRDYTKR